MSKRSKSISNWKWNKLFRKKKIDADCLKGNKKEFVKNKLTLKTQKRFKIAKHNVFTEVINKIALSSNDNKKSIDSIETYVMEWAKI